MTFIKQPEKVNLISLYMYMYMYMYVYVYTALAHTSPWVSGPTLTVYHEHDRDHDHIHTGSEALMLGLNSLPWSYPGVFRSFKKKPNEAA